MNPICLLSQQFYNRHLYCNLIYLLIDNYLQINTESSNTKSYKRYSNKPTLIKSDNYEQKIACFRYK